LEVDRRRRNIIAHDGNLWARQLRGSGQELADQRQLHQPPTVVRALSDSSNLASIGPPSRQQ
jgi:hypothetical protein